MPMARWLMSFLIAVLILFGGALIISGLYILVNAPAPWGIVALILFIFFGTWGYCYLTLK